ncbi:MAG: DUF433 domain-containing protein [Caldilineaceae bacterium]|nr:DUF433 domain-containing protein [Caldilineaceae bacterium]
MLENYFEYLHQGAEQTLVSIRVAGTRVGIEYILHDYLLGASPEELALRFPTLTLEQIHATITYFLAHKEEIDHYLSAVWQQQQVAWRASEHASSPFVQSLRKKLEAARLAQSDNMHSNHLAAD